MARLPSLLTVPILVVLIMVSVGNVQARSPIFDQLKQDNPETIVVPAVPKSSSTFSRRIRQTMSRAYRLARWLTSCRVVNIVQGGSTVVIPALSNVTIQHSVGTMELTEVTVNGVHYKLQTIASHSRTDRRPRQRSPSEKPLPSNVEVEAASRSVADAASPPPLE